MMKSVGISELLRRYRPRLRQKAEVAILGLMLALTIPSNVCSAENAGVAGGYTVNIGDKLKIRANEWPDVSGEYKVSPDKAIIIPILGQLSVAKKTPEDIAEMISARLRRLSTIGPMPTTTVEVIAYQPIYVTGYVMRPGQYEYSPGLSVLQAVSMAGGLFRFTDPGLQRLDRDGIQARGDLRTVQQRIMELRARQARVDASIANADTINFPQDLGEPGDEKLAHILDAERSVFTADKRSIQAEIISDAAMKELLEKEIASLQKEIDAQDHQLKAVGEEMKDLESLARKGLGLKARTYLLERTKAQIIGQIQSLQTNILRSRQNIAQATQRLNQFQSTRSEKLNAEKVATQSQLQEEKNKAQTLRGLIAEAEVSAPAQLALLYAQRKVTYMIVRSENNTESGVVENTALMPGDVLKVERVNDQSASQ